MSPDLEVVTLWKAEPLSPSSSSQLDVDEDWLRLDDDPVDIDKVEDPDLYDEFPTRAQMATKLLNDLDEWIKQEPLSDWLEEKINLPMFEELPIPECGQNKAIAYPTTLKQNHYQPFDSTETLLQEFESVFDNVEACHLNGSSIVSTLTPPQSPPPNKPLVNISQQLLITLHPVPETVTYNHPQPTAHVTVIPVEDKSSAYLDQISDQWSAENLSLEPLGGDAANDLAEVDEYVRACVKDIPPPSPCPSSNAGSTSSNSSEDSIDDPDWSSSAGSSSATSKRSMRSVSYSKSRRSKPYSRPNVEDKKVRKKEQNKNAATRYRQKKKLEIKEILGEEQELIDNNDSLQNQVKDLQREIGYLKGLMRDLFRAKGLMK